MNKPIYIVSLVLSVAIIGIGFLIILRPTDLFADLAPSMRMLLAFIAFIYGGFRFYVASRKLRGK